MNPTADDLRKLFEYDPTTGTLTWKERNDVSKSWNTRYAHKIAGTVAKNINTSGKLTYVTRIFVNYKPYLAHRIIWTLVTGYWPKSEIDHIDGNSLNNAWSNLREVDRTNNARNQAKRLDNYSNCPGVSWCKAVNKWRVRIKVDYKEIYLGCFKDINDAIAAREAANKEYNFHPNHGNR